MYAEYNRVNPKFQSEDSDYKFTAMRQTITVTKIVSIALLRPLPQAVEIPIMQFPGASVACESALGTNCSSGPSCAASAPNSGSGEKKRAKRKTVINASSQKTAQRSLRHDSRPNLRFLNQQPVSCMTVYAWFARKDKCQISGTSGKLGFSEFPYLSENRQCEFRFPHAPLKHIFETSKPEIVVGSDDIRRKDIGTSELQKYTICSANQPFNLSPIPIEM
ncbi:hypothetical protein YC2023_009934 [Brassica napus]